jgi:hypothetical protein
MISCSAWTESNLGNDKTLTGDNQHILKTLIVDDESLARRGLSHRLNNIADIEIVGEVTWCF